MVEVEGIIEKKHLTDGRKTSAQSRKIRMPRAYTQTILQGQSQGAHCRGQGRKKSSGGNEKGGGWNKEGPSHEKQDEEEGVKSKENTESSILQTTYLREVSAVMPGSTSASAMTPVGPM